MPVIFVTGATSGFGAATARLFARNGWKVIATGRRTERLQALAAEFPGLIHPAPLDLTDKQSVENAVQSLPAEFRPITCLFNNGGLALGSKPVPETRFEDWETMIDTNIKGLLYTTMACLPLLRAAGKGASIIGMILMNITPEESSRISSGIAAGLENGTLNPIVGREFPLSDAARAHEAVLAPGALGKIVLIPA